MSSSASPPQEPIDLEPIKARAGAATPGPWQSDIDHLGWEESVHYEVRTVEKQPGHPWSPRFLFWCHGSLGTIPAHRWPEMKSRGVREDPRIAADAEFVAHARQDIPALIAEVERLRAHLAEVEAVSPQKKNAK